MHPHQPIKTAFTRLKPLSPDRNRLSPDFSSYIEDNGMKKGAEDGEDMGEDDIALKKVRKTPKNSRQLGVKAGQVHCHRRRPYGERTVASSPGITDLRGDAGLFVLGGRSLSRKTGCSLTTVSVFPRVDFSLVTGPT
jgi:hypothetical protein